MNPRKTITISLSAILCVIVFGTARQTAEKSRPLTMTILYDNYPFQAGCTADWGFAALIEGLEKAILFDTGTKGDILLRNFEALKIDPAKSELIVISHDHGDHTGGVAAILEKKPGLPVFVPFSANPAFLSAVKEKGGQIFAVKESQALFQGAHFSGELGDAIHEQALILDAPRGLVVVTGCAHPGIIAILEKVKEIRKKDIWMVLGGFHLMQTAPAEVGKIIARFKNLGVRRVGATHCTGDAAIEMFRKAYGPDFVELGVGRKIDLAGR